MTGKIFNATIMRSLIVFISFLLVYSYKCIFRVFFKSISINIYTYKILHQAFMALIALIVSYTALNVKKASCKKKIIALSWITFLVVFMSLRICDSLWLKHLTKVIKSQQLKNLYEIQNLQKEIEQWWSKFVARKSDQTNSMHPF